MERDHTKDGLGGGYEVVNNLKTLFYQVATFTYLAVPDYTFLRKQ